MQQHCKISQYKYSPRGDVFSLSVQFYDHASVRIYYLPFEQMRAVARILQSILY